MANDEPIFELTPEDYEDLYFENDLTKHLDEALDYAKNKRKGSTTFVPIMGSTGSGKTSIVKSWLEHHKLKNWFFSACRPIGEVEVECYPELSEEPSVRVVSGSDLERILTPKKKKIKVLFSSMDIDNVDENTIVVIDDYDRADIETRAELEALIRYGKVIDPRVEDNSKTRILHPIMIIAILDSWNLDALTDAKKSLFGVIE